ncbi:MAG: hypothetical protein HY538_02570 [Deltaproteobacteria bacterium]|nr:hypothetical protein [Deltaproteobacteria bacterium]
MESNYHEEEIDLLDYWHVIWKRRRMIASLFFVSVVAAAVISLLLPEQYKAEVVLLPIEDSGMGGLASALAASPFASFVGGASSGGGTQKLTVVLQSRTLREKVVQRLNLLVLFNKKQWDPDRKRWLEPDKAPSLSGAARALSGMTKVDVDKKYGTLSLDVVYTDPHLAVEIANAYVAELADFLNTHSLNVNFQILDPAQVPEQKFKPNRRSIVKVSAALSILMGILVAFLLEYIQKMRDKSREQA